MGLRLEVAQDRNQLEAELKRLERYHLLVVDEVGCLPLERQAANLDLSSGRSNAPTIGQLNFVGLFRLRLTLSDRNVRQDRFVGRLAREFPKFAIEILLIVGIVDPALGRSRNNDKDEQDNSVSN